MMVDDRMAIQMSSERQKVAVEPFDLRSAPERASIKARGFSHRKRTAP